MMVTLGLILSLIVTGASICLELLLIKRRWFFRWNYAKETTEGFRAKFNTLISEKVVENLHLLATLRYFLLFILPLGATSVFAYLADTYLGEWNPVGWLNEHLLELLFAGFTLVVFTAIELPNLLTPKPLVVLSVYDRMSDGFVVSSELPAGEKATLVFSIRSTGLYTYKNCTVQIYFPYDKTNTEKNFEFIKNQTEIKDVEVTRGFSMRTTKEKKNKFVSFGPPNDYIFLRPKDVYTVTLETRTPKQEGEYNIGILLSPENTWGESTDNIRINVK